MVETSREGGEGEQGGRPVPLQAATPQAKDSSSSAFWWVAFFAASGIGGIVWTYWLASPQTTFGAFLGKTMLVDGLEIAIAVGLAVVASFAVGTATRGASLVTTRFARSAGTGSPGALGALRADLEGEHLGAFALLASALVLICVCVGWLALHWSFFWTLFGALTLALLGFNATLTKRYRGLGRWDLHRARLLIIPHLIALCLSIVVIATAIYLYVVWKANLDQWLIGSDTARRSFLIRWWSSLAAVLGHSVRALDPFDALAAFVWAGWTASSFAWFAPLIAARRWRPLIANLIGFLRPYAAELASKESERISEEVRKALHHMPAIGVSVALAVVLEFLSEGVREPLEGEACRKCGQPLHGPARYCGECGVRVEEAEGAAAIGGGAGASGAGG